LRHASDTSQALASNVIVGSLPGRGRSSSAAIGLPRGALDAALDRLMVQPQRPADRKKRRIFPVGQQYTRPLDPTRFAIALSISASPHPHPRATIQSPAATLP
jgi:hypothetical protein